MDGAVNSRDSRIHAYQEHRTYANVNVSVTYVREYRSGNEVEKEEEEEENKDFERYQRSLSHEFPIITYRLRLILSIPVRNVFGIHFLVSLCPLLLFQSLSISLI